MNLLWNTTSHSMADADYSYYDYQYSDWDIDTVDFHFVSGGQAFELDRWSLASTGSTGSVWTGGQYRQYMLGLDRWPVQAVLVGVGQVASTGSTCWGWHVASTGVGNIELFKCVSNIQLTSSV